MQAYKVENTKNFMTSLLVGEMFDDFLLEEAYIKTYNSFTIDGRIIPEFYDDYEFGYEFSSWKDSKHLCFDLIKGKQLPVSFHFILQLKPENINKLLSDNASTVSSDCVKSLTLNIKYGNGEITIVTASSMNSFTLDKSADKIWDEHIRYFLKDFISQ